MKLILFLSMLFSSCFAEYSISYNSLNLGVIKNINSVKDDYLRIEVTNPIARVLLGKDEMIFYDPIAKISKDENNVKYKKDKYFVINVIKNGISNNLKEGKRFIAKKKYLEITKEKDYKFKYVSKGRLKSYGTLIVKNQELISLTDEKNNIVIKKIEEK
jgi:hypothetical protein